MVSYSKKTGMKNISVLVLFMLLFSIITGALPVSAEDAAPANGTIQADQSILYAISKDNITTNLSGGISNDWTQARTSVVYNQEAGTVIGNTRFYTNAPAADNPTITAYINVNTAGTYEIKMGYKHQQTPNVSVSINGGTAAAVPTPSATADGKAEFWDVVGTFELKAGTNTIALTKSDNHESLGSLRMDSFLLIPASQETVTPSPAESPESSPEESPAPVTKETFLDESFADLPVGDMELTSWTTQNAPEAVKAEIIEIPAGSKSMRFSATSAGGGKQISLHAPAFSKTAAGEEIIVDMTFQNRTGSQNSLVFKDSNGKTVLNFDFIRAGSGSSTLAYVNDSGSLIKDTEYTYADNTWYRLIAVLNTVTLDYDFYMMNEDGLIIREYKNLKAIKGEWGATAPSNLNSFYMLMNDTAGALTIQSVKVFSDPDFVLPQEHVSPEPSPSDSPVVSPGPAEIIPAEGTVQADNSILYGIGVKNAATNIAGGFSDNWELAGDSVVYNTENVIGTTRFYTRANVPENPSITAHIKVETAGNYIVEMGYKHAQEPEIGVKVNGGPVIKMPSASKTADDKGEFWDRAGIFAMNEGTNTIEVIKLGPGNLRMDSFRLTATDEEPTEPEASPEPSTDLIYDDGNEAVFEIKNIPDILGMGQEKGTTSSSSGAFGNLHTYCNVDNSYALYTLKDAPAGVYEAYYFLPLVHSNNTDKMYIEVTDSNGKTSKHYYDIREGAGKSGENAAGDLRSNMYIKLGDDFVFNASKPGMVKVGKDVSTGHYRTDHIKLVKLSDIAVKPFARNLTITGLLKPGEKLTAEYEYVQENGYTEKDSVVKWYRGKSADGTEWTEIGQGLEYTLTDADADHYIKFEVTPKCDSTELNTGDTVNTVTGIIPAGDVPGTASNLILSGEETCYMPLTASYTYSDENLDPEGGSVYQWYRMDTKDGARTAISGANGTCKAGDQLSYTLTPEDIGKYITVGISVKSSNLTAQEVFSNVAGPVIEMQEIAPLARLQAVVGAGGTEKPLTAFYVFEHEKGIAEGDSLIQWYVSDTYDGEYTPIAGATDKTYQPTSDQMYKYIKFEVTPVTISGWTGNKVISEPKQIKWKMSWNDEFDYTAVDGNDPNFTKDWKSANETNADRPTVLGGRYPENVKVEDGNLKLLQKKENKGGKEWTSGSVMTNQQFGYGYYEARYQMVAATGLNQSFWAVTDPMDYMQPDKFEIDINEGHYPNTINPCIHYSVEGESGKREHIAAQGPYYPNYVNTIADDYHTFEME